MALPMSLRRRRHAVGRGVATFARVRSCSLARLKAPQPSGLSERARTSRALAMQKVVGSSPIIRFAVTRAPHRTGVMAHGLADILAYQAGSGQGPAHGDGANPRVSQNAGSTTC